MRRFLQLIFWLVVAKIALFYGLHFFQIGLTPDEAQYWTWSKDLSYGYYSKPAGIAWSIASGTHIFGDTELGVRLPAALLSLLLSLSIYWFGKRAGLTERASFWAAIAFSFCPIGIVFSFLATTDCPFLLFWTLACGVFAKPLLEMKRVPFSLVGLLIGVGALFKWPIYLLWVPIIGFSIAQRKGFFRLLFGILISACFLIPSLLWNVNHEWATLQHSFRSIVPDSLSKSSPNPFEFFIAQFGLASPIFFILILIALISLAFQLKKVPLSISFCWWTTVFIFGLVFVISFFKRVQANWAVAAYPTAFCLTVAWGQMRGESFFRWMKAGLIVSLLLVSSLFWSLRFLPYSMNPCKEALGWQNMGKGLLDVGYKPESDFLFADRYQTSSMLSFYGPQQKRAYFFNLHAIRKNQFSYWPGPKNAYKDKAGFYVLIIDGKNCFQKALSLQSSVKSLLKPYFKEVATPIVIVPLYEVAGKTQKIALVVRCSGYLGELPPDSGRY